MESTTDLPSLLLVDDDSDVRRLLRRLLENDFDVVETDAAAEALRLADARDPTIVLLDLNLGRGPEEGFGVLEELHRREPSLPIVILSDYRETHHIVRAMKSGATHYVGKTPEDEELRELLNVLARERRRAFHLESHRSRGLAIVGASPAMIEVRRRVQLAARSDIPVLILGETGSGKNHVAERIHADGPRKAAPFKDVNVAGLSTTLLDSELFGHERGAFTGAEKRHRGLFELASGGTILLDEIGDLPRESQVKLLKVVESGWFRRVGGETEIRTDARILAATHAALESLVTAKAFRADLYHRLAGLVIHVPPLRERTEDIPLLVREFLGPEWTVTEDALAALAAHKWPGNVRELLQTLRRSTLAVETSVLDRSSLVFESLAREPIGGDTMIFDLPFKEAFESISENFRRQYIRRVLRASGGNVAQAARTAGIARPHLHAMMKELGIEREGDGVAE